MPKEVGKVGTESPTFIEPIANRKDGIQAMFSKQREKGVPSSPAKSTSVHTKRKLEESPTPSSSSKSPNSTQSPSKKSKKATRDDSSQPESVSTNNVLSVFLRPDSMEYGFQSVARDVKSKPRDSRKVHVQHSYFHFVHLTQVV